MWNQSTLSQVSTLSTAMQMRRVKSSPFAFGEGGYTIQRGRRALYFLP